MLTGRISDLQAWVAVEILDNYGESHPVEVVLDTGFDGQLAFPISVIRWLELVRAGLQYAELADGNTSSFMSYRATILWYGQPRAVQVIEADSEPLLGMALLLDSLVTLQVREGGPVTIAPLP